MRNMRFTDSVTKKPRNVWLDGDCQIPHAQPVFCDADGMWPPIFIEGHGNDCDVRMYDDEKLLYSVTEVRSSNRLGFWWHAR